MLLKYQSFNLFEKVKHYFNVKYEKLPDIFFFNLYIRIGSINNKDDKKEKSNTFHNVLKSNYGIQRHKVNYLMANPEILYIINLELSRETFNHR